MTSTKAEGRHGSALVQRLGSNHKTTCKWSLCILEKSRAEAPHFGLVHIIQYYPSAPAVFSGLFHKGTSSRRARRRAVGWLYVCRPSSRSAWIQPRFGRARGTQTDEVVERKFQGSQLPKTPSRRSAAIPTPNPSVEARPNGKPPGPGQWYAVHFHRPGPGVLPSAPPHLKR